MSTATESSPVTPPPAAPPSVTPVPFYRSPLAAGLAIVVLTFLAHGNALFNSFIWDDDMYVYTNQTLLSVKGLQDIWLVPEATPQYYPLVHTTFWIEHALWGFWPMGFHFDNILIHAISSVLVWLLLRRLKVPGAWAAAAVFAVHPVTVETVAWVTERKNTLSTLFYLAGFHAYLSFSPADEDKAFSKRDWRFFMLSLVLFGAALLSKTVTCTLPAAILLIYWWKRPRPSAMGGDTWAYVAWRDLACLVPFFAIGVVLGLHTAHLETTHVGATGAEWDSIHFVERCLIAGNAIAFYAWKLVWPVDLTFIYPYPLKIITRSNPALFVAPILVAATILAAFLLQKKITRGPVTGLLFFVITLFPALGFLNVFPFRYSIVADHFQYLASLGMITLLCAGATLLMSGLLDRLHDKLPVSKTAFMGVTTTVVLVSLSMNSLIQALAYRDLETLWLDTILKNPDCWLARNNLGILYQNAGRDDLARDHFAKAVEVSPESFESRSNYGLILAEFGENDLALEQFSNAIKISPQRPDAYLNAGTVLVKLGGADQGRAYLERALAMNRLVEQRRPDNSLAIYGEGRTLMELGRYDEAIGVFEKNGRLIEPDNAELYELVGICHLRAGRTAQAAEMLEKAVESSHDNPMLRTIRSDSKNLLSRVYSSSQESAALNPDLMAVIEQDMRRFAPDEKDPAKYRAQIAFDLATDACQIATKDSPKYPYYLDSLAMAHASAGRFAAAVDVANAAIAFAQELHLDKLVKEIEARKSLFEQSKVYVAPGANLFQE